MTKRHLIWFYFGLILVLSPALQDAALTFLGEVVIGVGLLIMLAASLPYHVRYLRAKIKA